MKILLVINFSDPKDPFNVGGVEYHRLLIPFINLGKTHGIIIDQINEIDPDKTDLSQYDLAVFSRVLSVHGRDEVVLEALKKARLPYVVDVDDFWQLPPSHLLAEQWNAGRMSWKIQLAIKNAAGVITTHQHLKNQVKPLNKNVVVAANAIDPAQPQFNPIRLKSPVVRIGWVGGVSHVEDIPLIEKGMKELYASDLQDYVVNMCGFNIKNANIWLWFENIFTAGIPNNRNYIRRDGVRIDEYAQFYREIDIALAPLADTAFNRCKSELKLIEAGWFGVPVIASNVYPYNMKQFAGGVVYADNKHQWFKKIRNLILNQSAREDYGARLQAIVKEHYTIDKVNPVRLELISKII